MSLAVSNALGSNIFHVLIRLGVPWLGNVSRLSLVELLHYCALIGREIHSVAMPALLCYKEPAPATQSLLLGPFLAFSCVFMA